MKALVRLSGVLGVLLLWELLAITVTAHAIPTPPATIRQLFEDGWAFYGPNIRSTGWEALRGFFWGNVMAIALAVVVILAPPLERLVTQIGTISYCLQVVAVGPILTVGLYETSRRGDASGHLADATCPDAEGSSCLAGAHLRRHSRDEY